MNEWIYFLKYRNISVISALVHTIPPIYRTYGHNTNCLYVLSMIVKLSGLWQKRGSVKQTLIILQEAEISVYLFLYY